MIILRSFCEFTQEIEERERLVRRRGRDRVRKSLNNETTNRTMTLWFLFFLYGIFDFPFLLIKILISYLH